MRLPPLISLLVSISIVVGITALPASANSATRENQKEDQGSQTSLSMSKFQRTHRKAGANDTTQGATFSDVEHQKREQKHSSNREKETSDRNQLISQAKSNGSHSGNGFLSELPFPLLNKEGRHNNSFDVASGQNKESTSNRTLSASSTLSKNPPENGGLLSLFSLPFSWFGHAHGSMGTTGSSKNIGAATTDPISAAKDARDGSKRSSRADSWARNPGFPGDLNGSGGSNNPSRPGGPEGPRIPLNPGDPNGPGGSGNLNRPGGPNGPGGPGNPNRHGRPNGPGLPINPIYPGDPNLLGGPVNPNLPGGANGPGGPISPVVPGSRKPTGVGFPVSTSPSFADLHKQQTQISAPRTAQYDKLTQVTPAILPQAPRTHKDWGQIGGMTQGGLTSTEPPSPNNFKQPVPGQYNAPVPMSQQGVAHGTANSFVFVPGESPPVPPFWFSQPASNGTMNGIGQWYPGPISNPGVPYTAGLQATATTMGAAISAEIAATPNFQASQAKAQAETQNFANATNAASNSNLQSGMSNAIQSLVNIANENSAGPYGKAVKMVQAMWRSTFLPIAILLVLPGTLLTQVKGLVKVGVIDDANDEDGVSPFVGLLRGMIAIFLIPATQLIVSYTIDIGNSMTEVVAQQVQLQDVSSWADSQTSKPKAANAAAQAALDAKESGRSAFKRASFGFIDSLFTNALVILLAYQTVMICYLFLLGPIAAAFYAWPSTTNALFKNVFSNWINGLISLALWRFWWSLIILCMCIRIQWLKDLGEYNPNSPWEGIVYTAFVVMLTYVPFMPFEFKPGSMVTSLLDKAGQGGANGGSASSGDPNAGGAQTPKPA